MEALVGFVATTLILLGIIYLVLHKKPKRYKCPWCDMEFTNLLDYIDHKDEHLIKRLEILEDGTQAGEDKP